MAVIIITVIMPVIFIASDYYDYSLIAFRYRVLMVKKRDPTTTGVGRREPADRPQNDPASGNRMILPPGTAILPETSSHPASVSVTTLC